MKNNYISMTFWSIFNFTFLIFNCLYAQQSGGIFLEIPSSVRAGGMAESYTALSNETFGLHYNPAGISFIENAAVSFLHHIYLQDFNGEFLGFVKPVGKFAVGCAPAYIGMKQEPIYDTLGNETGESFQYNGLVIPAAVSYLLSKNVAIGTNLKHYSETIDDFSQSVFTVDVGSILSYRSFRLGVSGLNLIGELEGYQLPRTLKTGLAVVAKKFTLSTEFDRQLVKQENLISVGAEVPVAKIFYLRAGYKIKGNGDFGGPTGGVGINWKGINLDYAFSGYGDLGTTHRAGISLALLPEKEKVVEEKREVSVEKPEIITKPVIEKPTVQINIAVADFTGNNVSQADATIVAGFLRTELVKIGYYNVIEKANMDKILAEAAFQQTGCTTSECAVQIGKLLNVREMVVGSLSKLMDTYFITVNLVEVETGKILKSEDIKAQTAADLRAACKELAERICQ
ncbi:MAG: PorV/PorQ family protein [Elusimicrobiota bacterium]